MSRVTTALRNARHLVGVALASAMFAALPQTALAATPATEPTAIVAQEYEEKVTDNVSIARVKFETSYPYTGGPVEPMPIVYLTLRDAYRLKFIGASFTEGEYDRFLEDVDAYEYYYNHYHGTPEFSDDFYQKDQDLTIYDVFEFLDEITDKNKLFTYYNITEDYFDWIRNGNVILDPSDNRGFVYRLAYNTDYTLSYKNNVGPGVATLILKGEDPLYGEAEYDFNIGTTSQAGYERISGPTRYDTMAEIVARNFARPCTYAVVATGQNFPDALSASSLAGAYQAPVILTETNSLSPQARTQLSNLGITNVFLMGGTSAVGTGVENDLKAMNITVTRIAGDGRVGTSLRAMEATYAGGSTSDTIIIATGYQFADSLSIGPWAYASKTPIVLTNQDGVLTDDAVKAIRSNTTVTRIVIVGGTAAVRDNVRTQLSDAYSFERLSGSDRYETSARIAEWLATTKQFSWNAPIIATGTNFPDALAGSPLAGKTKQPVLLVSKRSDATVNTLISHKDKVTTFFVLGGEGAVSKSLADDIAASLR